MTDKNEVRPFRFNQSKINSTKNNVPSTIDWNTLKNSIAEKSGTAQSLWGMVQTQQNSTKKK